MIFHVLLTSGSPRHLCLVHSRNIHEMLIFFDPAHGPEHQLCQLSKRSRERQRQELLYGMAVPIYCHFPSGQVQRICDEASYGCPKQTWNFIEPTDHEFMSSFPELVQAESKRWQNMECWFNNDLDHSGAPNLLSIPPCVSPGISAEARSFVCSLLQRCGIVRLSTIRTCLEKHLVSGLASVAFLCEAELLGIFGRNVMCIQGACVLRSIGDNSIDPFRILLLELLHKNDRSVNRSDLLEKALSLGNMPSNSSYIRCLGDLCFSRGNSWVMKYGHERLDMLKYE